MNSSFIRLPKLILRDYCHVVTVVDDPVDDEDDDDDDVVVVAAVCVCVDSLPFVAPIVHPVTSKAAHSVTDRDGHPCGNSEAGHKYAFAAAAVATAAVVAAVGGLGEVPRELVSRGR